METDASIPEIEKNVCDFCGRPLGDSQPWRVDYSLQLSYHVYCFRRLFVYIAKQLDPKEFLHAD